MGETASCGTPKARLYSEDWLRKSLVTSHKRSRLQMNIQGHAEEDKEEDEVEEEDDCTDCLQAAELVWKCVEEDDQYPSSHTVQYQL